MAEVVIDLGGRPHRIACAEGSEEQVRRLGIILQQHWQEAEKGSGGLSYERTMLFLALILADALDEAERNPGGAPRREDPLLAGIATRLEAIATSLEQGLANP